jgi:hypothetical protein
VEVLNQLDSVAMLLRMTSMLLKHMLVITFAYGAKNVKSHSIGYRQTILTSVAYHWNCPNTKNALKLDILKFRNNILEAQILIMKHLLVVAQVLSYHRQRNSNIQPPSKGTNIEL